MLITANILCITLVIYKSKTTFRRRILAKRRRWRILSCCRTAGYPISAVCPEAGLSRLPLPAVLSLSAAGPDFWAGGFFAAAQRAAEKEGRFSVNPHKIDRKERPQNGGTYRQNLESSAFCTFVNQKIVQHSMQLDFTKNLHFW